MATAHLVCSHNYTLVALSVLIAMFASYAALDLAGRVTAAGGWIRAVWLLGGAGAMGTGIWSMHYIGMLACILPVPVAYHWPTVLLSLLAAILASAIALYVVSRQKMGAFRAFVGSVLMGGGIASMHYIGMAAMRMSAISHYDSFLVILSVVFAVLISLAALWITFHLRDEKAATGWRKIAGAIVMGAAIPVMHYTGMAAAHFTPSAMPADLSRAISISTLGTADIAAVTFIVLGLALLTSWVDKRFAAQSLELQEKKLQRSEAYLAEAQKLSHTGSFGWKVSTGEIIWSEETYRIFQYDKTTTPTVESVLQRVHPEDAALVKQTIERASQNGKDFDFEHRLLMPDGSVKYVRVVTHAGRDELGGLEFVGAVLDVTVAKEAEDKIRLIINTVPGLLWTARPDGWVDFLSQRWLDYTGMTLEQGLGWAWQPGYHPDDLGNVLSKWRAAVAERKPLEVEARLRRFDGEYRWFLKRAFPLFDNAGRVLGWYGGNIDIHDLKQAEEKLRESETYLSEGQRLSHTGSWAWSVKTKENLFWSREHYRIYGFDPDTESGQYAAARERIHPADLRAFDENLNRAIEEKSDFEIDYRIVLPGGEEKYIHNLGHPRLNDAGELVEYIGTTMDVTEQVQARTALEEAFSKIKKSEARLQAIIDTIPTLAWSTEPDGSAEFLNLRWRNYTGLSTEEAQGWGWQVAIHPEDVGWLSDQWRSTMASGKPCELEARLRRYDGQYRWFIFRADPLVDDQGKILKWYGTNTDIDDRKRAEEALRQAQADLAHVSRVTTMGELTASIAHEVNQPLTAVVNNANACFSLLDPAPQRPGEGGPGGASNLEEVRAALTEIIEDTNRASAVIARVRQLAKKAPFERTFVDLRDVITDVCALARYESASRRVTIRIVLPHELPPILGDRVQLQQVLLNLVVNGMDAMNAVEESQRVLIICGRRETRDGAPEAWLSVQDAGTGLKSGEMERLFEAFYTTKPHGMGMGLAISRSIIEAHGGRLWAEPNQGPGTAFLFTLPAAPEPSGEGGSAAGNSP
jgi:PAS domain S-box-containing protein